MARKTRSAREWTNKEVAEVLEEMGTLLELDGENPFKVRAHYNAARVLRAEERAVGDLVREGTLGELPGFGEALTEKVTSLIETGEIPAHQELRRKIPPGILELLAIPGLGPKKAKAIWRELGVTTAGELEYACKENRLLDLPGFGRKTQDHLLEGIEHLKRNRGKFLVGEAMEYARAALHYLRDVGEVRRAEFAGSLRRCKEVVQDVDLLVAGDRPEAVMRAFVKMPGVAQVLQKGETKSSVVLRSGLQMDLRVVTEAQYPYALHYFTGSKEHNIAMRARAKALGLKLNEYGLFKGAKEKLVPCKDEAELFAALGLSFIPPEMREDMGEIAAAEAGELPELIETADVRGSLHNHSDWSDGGATLAHMAEAARALGHAYFGITDHSRSARYAHGLEVERVRKQQAEADKLNKGMKGFRILKGIEADILADGAIDYPDSVLRTFDFVVASVHSRMTQDRATMTKRLIRAVENPRVRILGHPTGRLLLGREGYDFDLDAVLRAAAKHAVAMEINANPHRLDLDWRVLRKAKAMGVRFSINPDAHAPEGLKDVPYGVGIARKGWLTKDDVINTASADQLLERWRR